MSIAIAISTRGREDVLNHSVSQWKKHYPDASIIIIEDNGDIPRGISATKNLCIEALIESGAEHCFLADDDVYPTNDIGLHLYIGLNVNHACMSFDHTSNGKRISNEVFVHLKHPYWWSFNSPCGCLLYVSRELLLSGIRYDENFIRWGLEHKDFSIQVHKRGYTSIPFIDIPNSTDHFYSHDYHLTAESSVPEHVRIDSIKRNTEYFNEKHNVWTK